MLAKLTFLLSLAVSALDQHKYHDLLFVYFRKQEIATRTPEALVQLVKDTIDFSGVPYTSVEA